MHLNQLYGYFGRNLEQIETVNIHISDLESYLLKNVIENYIHVNDEILVLLIKSNLSLEVVKELNIILNEVGYNIHNNQSIIRSNVAIASAVTAYARITMIPYKLLPGTVYTDSIFTTDKLPNHLIGKELGQMKDELDGNIIKEGYFLGLKQYGYYYLDETGNKIERSVFAGVKRDGLTFIEVESIFNGNTITKFIPLRFYKSLESLNIHINSTKISIKMNATKLIINGNYIPININLINKNKLINTLLNIVKKN